MIRRIEAQALRAFLSRNDEESARAALATQHPTDIASILAELSDSDAARVLRLLPEKRQAQAFGYLDVPKQLALARSLERTEMGRIFAAMEPDERADLFKRLPETERAALLPGLAHAEREDLRRLASYPEGTAGALMTSAYAVLRPDETAREALAHLRLEAPDAETIYTAYVVDTDGVLLGVVSLRDLILADEARQVRDIMRGDPVTVRPDDTKDVVAEKIATYDILSVPVVTAEGRLVGIVTVDDAFDVAREERGRRLVRFGAAAPIGGGPDLDLRNSSLGQLFRVRVMWLTILTLFGAITSTFVATQQEMLEAAIILAAFIAPIVDMGGNTGSQSATLVIRSMALGQFELNWRDIWFVIRREIPVALAMGVVIALLEAVLAFFSKGVGGEVLLVVGLSMAACTILGALIGALLPFAARRIGTDPATLSSPLITSIMDLLGVLIYFGLASVFLGHMLAGG